MVDAHDAETYTAQDSRMIWIDCEMTGLDIFHDELCEVSVVPTDFDLNVLDEGVDYVVKPSDAAVAHMNDFVRAMHTRSGLINEWEHGLSLEEAECKVTEYVARFTPDGVKPLLAGNSVGSDKKFLDRYMPGLMEHLHYRVIDVSTIKELARRWYPDVYRNRPAKNGGHRALADIIESIDELRYSRLLFVPAPADAEAAAGARHIEATSLLRTYEKNGQRPRVTSRNMPYHAGENKIRHAAGIHRRYLNRRYHHGKDQASVTRWTTSMRLTISHGGRDMDLARCLTAMCIPEGSGRCWRMQQAGIEFVPASGRQIFTLRDMFGEAMPSGSFIAENGNLVVAKAMPA